jgi:septal ring factor EnvC (AmiA/AmiB activator)
VLAPATEPAKLTPNRRKQQLNSQNSELEALEARIREMEQRLQQRSSPNSSLNQQLAQAQAQHQVRSDAINSQRLSYENNNRQRRSPIAGVFPQQQGVGDQQDDLPPPLPEKDHAARSARTDKYGAGSRPGTARQSQQAVPGALPPTPTSSDGEDA